MKLLQILKKFTLFFLLLYFFQTHCSSLYAHENEQPTTIECIASGKTIEYVINQELKTKPHDSSYYHIILQELNALEACFCTTETISLTTNTRARSIAPHVFHLIANKAKKIADRMGVDMNTVQICIEPTAQDVKSAFNAHAQTSLQLTVTKKTVTETVVENTIRNNTVIDSKVVETKTTEHVSHDLLQSHKLSINAESLKFFAWHEGHSQYDQIEGLFDGVIAHELAHIFHNHSECSIECECQADATGAKNLHINPYEKLIGAIDILYFAGNLFSALKSQQSLLRLDNATIFNTVNAITSSLVHQVKDFGHLSQCSSHTQFACKMQRAIGKALQRIASHRAFGNKNITASLLYDELKDCCQTPLDSNDGIHEIACKLSDNQMALYSQLTHPDPQTRRVRLALALNQPDVQLSLQPVA